MIYAFALLQNVLKPAGPQAARAPHRCWFIFWICVVVYAIVVGLAVFSVLRRKRAPEGDERAANLNVGIAVGITTLVVFAVLIASSVTGHEIATPPQGPVDIMVQ